MMPETENYPAWGRIPIRLIVAVQYLMLGALAAHVAFDPPRAMADLVGADWVTWVSGFTSAAFAVAGAAHAFHKWLLERALLPVSTLGLLVLDVMLWAAVPEHQADPDAALLLLIVIFGLVVRALGLEVFAHQHRPTWRRRARS